MESRKQGGLLLSEIFYTNKEGESGRGGGREREKKRVKERERKNLSLLWFWTLCNPAASSAQQQPTLHTHIHTRGSSHKSHWHTCSQMKQMRHGVFINRLEAESQVARPLRCSVLIGCCTIIVLINFASIGLTHKSSVCGRPVILLPGGLTQ